MDDAPLGAQPRRGGDDGAEQFVGVQAALHQRVDLARRGEFDGLGRSGVAVLGGLDRDPTSDSPASLAAACILCSGPTSTGAIRPSSRASTAAESASTSRGCTIAVGIGGSSRALRRKRSKRPCRRVATSSIACPIAIWRASRAPMPRRRAGEDIRHADRGIGRARNETLTCRNVSLVTGRPGIEQPALGVEGHGRGIAQHLDPRAGSDLRQQRL